MGFLSKPTFAFKTDVSKSYDIFQNLGLYTGGGSWVHHCERSDQNYRRWKR